MQQVILTDAMCKKINNVYSSTNVYSITVVYVCNSVSAYFCMFVSLPSGLQNSWLQPVFPGSSNQYGLQAV